MLTAFRNALVLLVCGLAATAPAAAAQDDEVFVDPGSPSGKEYALPIDTARRQGAANTRKQQPGREAGDAPLFGEGVSADDDGAGTSARTRPRDGSRASQNEDAETTSRAESAQAGAAAERTAQAAGPGGAGSLAAIAGVGLGVVMVGGLAGLLLRRRRV